MPLNWIDGENVTASSQQRRSRSIFKGYLLSASESGSSSVASSLTSSSSFIVLALSQSLSIGGKLPVSTKHQRSLGDHHGQQSVFVRPSIAILEWPSRACTPASDGISHPSDSSNNVTCQHNAPLFPNII
jgi:hypothetical protein